MSALREWAAALGPDAHSAVAVSWLGKWKTATQMASLTLLLLGRCAERAAAGGGGWAPPAPLATAAAAAGLPLLAVAALLTLWSLGEYFAGLSRFMFPPG